jgi:hypothetical protein
MKKLIAAGFTAVLMSGGLVVATGGTASADCTPNNYAGCVATKTKATGPGVVVQGAKATVCASVKAKGSNATPTGRVVFKVTRNAGGYFFKKAVSYSGGEVCVKTTKLAKKGGYSVDAKFKAPDSSAFINSEDGTGFDVVS